MTSKGISRFKNKFTAVFRAGFWPMGASRGKIEFQKRAFFGVGFAVVGSVLTNLAQSRNSNQRWAKTSRNQMPASTPCDRG
jgi:hypothetical protein